jgi:hypothetical protein
MNQNTYELVKFGCLSGAIGLSLFLVDRVVWKDYDVPEYKTFSAYIPKLPPLAVKQITLKEKILWCSQSSQCKKLFEAVVYEERSESLMGMFAVANVVMNRVHSKKWPNTITSVIHQPKQFSYLKDMHMQKQPKESDWNAAKVVAYDTIHGKIGDVSNGATHYYNPNKVNPKWSDKLEYVVTIGEHRFMK